MFILSEKTLLKTPVFDVCEMTVHVDSGTKLKRSVVNHRGSAVVVPMDGSGNIFLVSQYRAPIRTHILEFPAGRIEEGETPLGAAKRELLEEAGCRAKYWTSLGYIYPTPGYVSEKMHLYLATGLRVGKSSPEEDEYITPHWFNRSELEARVDKRRITDAKTLAGLLLVWRLLDAGKISPAYA